MALPISKSALDRLGARMAADIEIAESNYVEFSLVADAYQQTANGVQSQLEELGYEATPRVKTTGTLVDKLRREHGMRLSQMQDIAGARILVEDRAKQDEAVQAICELYAHLGHACKVYDRREHPSHGYRAIHVVVSIDQILMEVQVRTPLQDSWAQMIEDLADSWGRGIRYGEDPLNPDAQVPGGKLVASRRQVVSFVGRLSEIVAMIETTRTETQHLTRLIAQFETSYGAVSEEVTLGAALSKETRDGVGSLVANAASVGVPAPEGDPDHWGLGDLLSLYENLHRYFSEALRSAEVEVRDMLQVLASAAEEQG